MTTDPGPQRQPASDAESLAKLFHETYERLAPQFGYETRKASAVPWDQVPEQNKALMIAVCEEIKNWLCPAMQDMGAKHVLITRDELALLRQSLRQARELIEATVNSVRQFKIILAGHETLHVNTDVLEAAYKWLEENGDA